MTRSVAVRAYAKINLHLDVLGRRGDGYHDLSTIFQEIDLADELRIAEAPGDTDALVVDGAVHIPADGRNLVLKAIRRLRDHTNGRLPVLAVRLTKTIPDGAGLGGGSSDAAAAIVAANELFRLGLSCGECIEVAAGIGSDCAFFVRGGTQSATGRGELLSPARRTREFHVLLVVPHCRVATIDAYGALDPEELGPVTDGGALRQWLAGADVPVAPRNTFQSGVRHRHPAIDATLSAMESTNPLFCLLSGSGSGCFALYATAEDANRAAEAMPSAARLVRVCRPVGGRSGVEQP